MIRILEVHLEEYCSIARIFHCEDFHLLLNRQKNTSCNQLVFIERPFHQIYDAILWIQFSFLYHLPLIIHPRKIIDFLEPENMKIVLRKRSAVNDSSSAPTN